jgi:hypothetical protein
VRAVDNDSQWRLSGPVAGRLLGTVEQPGRYLISAPAKARYVFSPREVTIGPGEHKEVDIAVRQNR